MARTNAAPSGAPLSPPRNNSSASGQATVVVRSVASPQSNNNNFNVYQNAADGVTATATPHGGAAPVKTTVSHSPKQLPPSVMNGTKHNHLDDNHCDITQVRSSGVYFDFVFDSARSLAREGKKDGKRSKTSWSDGEKIN